MKEKKESVKLAFTSIVKDETTIESKNLFSSLVELQNDACTTVEGNEEDCKVVERKPSMSKNVVPGIIFCEPVKAYDKKMTEHEIGMVLKSRADCKSIGDTIFIKDNDLYYTPILSNQQLISTVKSVLPSDYVEALSVSQYPKILSQAASEAGDYYSMFPANTYVVEVPFANGIIDIQTGVFRRKSNDEEMIHLYNDSNYPYKMEPEYGANIEAFLKYASGGDDTWVEAAWYVIGAILGSSVRYKKLFLIYGRPNTGKSVFVNLLSHLVGMKFTSTVKFQNLVENFALEKMPYSKLIIAPDSSSKPFGDISALKSLSSGGLDLVSITRKYKGAIDVLADNVRVVIATNHPPRFDHISDIAPFFERMFLLPFMFPVDDNTRDNNLLEKILLEKEYIVKKGMRYYAKLVDNKFMLPMCLMAEELKESWFKRLDSINGFVKDRCSLGKEYRVRKKDFIDTYKDYCYETSSVVYGVNDVESVLNEQYGVGKKRHVTDAGKNFFYEGIALN